MYKRDDEEQLVEWRTTGNVLEEDGKVYLKFAIPLGMINVVCQANLDYDDVNIKAFARDKAAGTEELIGERIYKSKIITTSKGKDALVFTIPLGFLKVICIANIPDEDDENQFAPVYVKFKFFDKPLRKADGDRRDSVSP